MLLAVLFLGLLPLAAPAREIRFPAKGYPAFTFDLPEDWSAQADDSGNLIMASASRTTSLVILVGETTDPLDKIAAEALKVARAVPAQGKQGIEISGCKGFIYFSTMKNSRGVRLDLEMTIVRVDPNHIASSSLILVSGVSKVNETTARTVQRQFHLRLK